MLRQGPSTVRPERGVACPASRRGNRRVHGGCGAGAGLPDGLGFLPVANVAAWSTLSEGCRAGAGATSRRVSGPRRTARSLQQTPCRRRALTNAASISHACASRLGRLAAGGGAAALESRWQREPHRDRGDIGPSNTAFSRLRLRLGAAKTGGCVQPPGVDIWTLTCSARGRVPAMPPCAIRNHMTPELSTRADAPARIRRLIARRFGEVAQEYRIVSRFTGVGRNAPPRSPRTEVRQSSRMVDSETLLQY